VVVVSDEALDDARGIAAELRSSGINVEVDITGRKLDKQIKTAVKKGIDYLLFVGPQDVATGEYSLKRVENEQEEKLTVEQIAEKFST